MRGRASAVPAMLVDKKGLKSGKSVGVAGASFAGTPGSSSSSVEALVGGCAAPVCCGCKRLITSDINALQCDGCQSAEVWKCAECLNLAPRIYASLIKDCKELKWFCQGCEWERLQGRDKKLDGSGEILKILDKVLDKLTLQEDRLRDKVEVSVFEDGMSKKVDVSVLESLERRLAAMEKKLERMADFPVLTEGQGKQSGGRVDRKVGEEEEGERERRKNCVIVRGMRESESLDAQVRIEEDRERVKELFKCLDCDDACVSKVLRLGSRLGNNMEGKDGEKSEDSKPRPLKLVLTSEEEKNKILGEAKNLRLIAEGGWDKVFVHQDRTPGERERRYWLGVELKKRREEGEKDLVIFRGRIIMGRPRQVVGPTDLSS